VVQLIRLWFVGDCRVALSCIRKQARSGDVEVPPQRRIAGTDQEVRVGLVQVSILAVPGTGGVRIRQADTVHQERGAGLAAEFGLDAADGTGHEPQRKPGHVAWRASAPGGCLDRSGELVKGEVAGAADLEDAAAGGGVGYGVFDERGDVCNGDEVDRVVPPSEDDGPARAGSGAGEDVDL
jgi:hypothetical protein